MKRLGRDRPRLVLIGVALGLTVVAITTYLVASSPTASPGPTPSPFARATQPPTPTPTPTPTARPTATATPEPTPALAAFEDDGRLTVLVLGSDSSAARRSLGHGSLTDAITVITVREDGEGLALFSLPRDTTDVQLPDGRLWTAKINALAPALGPRVTADTIGGLLGITIDHYVQIDMDGLVQLVDAVGGVTVEVSHVLADSGCTIEPGTQHLDGALALCFARHRKTDDDYARAARHQLLLLALRDAFVAGDVDPTALLGSLATLETDMELDQVGRLLGLAEASAPSEADALVLGPPDYTEFVGLAGPRGWISTPNVAAIRDAVDSALQDEN
jgi:LCP family protein required for cell wall assembly